MSNYHRIRGVMSVIGGFLIMLTAGAFHGTIGNMAPYFASYIRQFDETITNEDLGVVLAVGGIFQGVGALLGGSVIIPWFGYRIALLCGILVYCSAPILSYFSLTNSTLTTLTFSYGVLSAAVVNLIMMPSQYIPCSWFPNRKGLVIGIIFAGFGLSPAVFSPLQTLIINPDNTPPLEVPGSNSTSKYFLDPLVLERIPLSLLYMAGIYIVLFTIGFLLCTEYKDETKIDLEKTEKPVPNFEAVKTRIKDSTNYIQKVGVRSREFYLLSFARYALLVVGGGIFMHWKGLSLRLSSDDQMISIIGGINGLMSCIGRIVVGILIDRFSFNCLMPAVSIGMTLVMILTVPVSWYSFWGFVVLLWLGYFLSFMHFITVPFQIMKIYGDKQSSSVLGLVGAVDSLVYATIGVLNLAVFSYTESFLPYFLSLAGFSLMTAGANFFIQDELESTLSEP
ncbi:uncharacterized protein LOC111711868 isoform X2 [Eurytemora carolleeae]|uniref:uncharacterized protein LOC111711868 isoform X2 n=1 Tax=Eurytemora carolleeae TaxID=1294199 RepID=UPI000C766365|nr:uncharacterized protein LOC111711868 isoform X2 [Eurytemora carolleeae]|eukprot:XP_023342097.1 uncharacterized protein LOC111711868 isoform X2 [Eurytemora affinis]